jgi:hypothetical protein
MMLMIVKIVRPVCQKRDDYQLVALLKAARLLGLRVGILSAACMNVSCECCVLHMEACAMGRSLVQGSPTEGLFVVQCNYVKLTHYTDPQRVGRSGRTKNIP